MQHHPARAALLPRLLGQLDGAGEVEVVEDPEPGSPLKSPWRCYRAALERTPAWATHRLVIQDDALPCRSFGPAMLRALEARPGRLVAFFVAGEPLDHRLAIQAAHDRGHDWAELRNDRWCPAVALAWPAAMALDCPGWADAQGWPDQFRADDEIVGRYLAAIGAQALATVPSLVEHPDVEASLLHRRAMGGLDPGRVAACWIHPDCDPLAIEWRAGP